jgi:hypothetical protein
VWRRRVSAPVEPARGDFAALEAHVVQRAVVSSLSCAMVRRAAIRLAKPVNALPAPRAIKPARGRRPEPLLAGGLLPSLCTALT